MHGQVAEHQERGRVADAVAGEVEQHPWYPGQLAGAQVALSRSDEPARGHAAAAPDVSLAGETDHGGLAATIPAHSAYRVPDSEDVSAGAQPAGALDCG